jgi:integrase
VKEYWGIWYFDITDSKTDAGIRRTPVSDILIQLGFLDFLEQRKNSGEEHLLMCWLPAPNHAYVPVPPEKYGSFFKNLKKKMKVEIGPNEKKDLHSLRHNYSDALKQAGVRPDIIDELCGHEHAPGSMRSIYDEKYELPLLAENLKQASWKCDFSVLRTSKRDK